MESDVNADDVARMFQGHHETEACLQGEADLSKSFVSCTKKAGHGGFLTVREFAVGHLPEALRDETLHDLIKVLADLTVKLSLTCTSADRPSVYPGTRSPYPFHENRGSDVFRTGSGRVWDVKKFTENDNRPCPCTKCDTSTTPSKVWGEIRLNTATHVVFDETEALQTTCRFFYDSAQSPEVKVRVSGYGWGDTDTDRCWLKCVTCDVRLVNKLAKVVERWRDLRAQVYKKYHGSRDSARLAVIVSHPHGCPKMISVGRWTFRRGAGKCDSRYTYTTATCPGSSGAFVFILGGGGWMYHNHLHSGVNMDGINFCGNGRDL